MESLSDLEWTAALQGLLADPEAPTDAEYRAKDYSSRPCPHCTEYTLLRRPLRNSLRIFRRVGIDLRHYWCETCKRNCVVKNP